METGGSLQYNTNQSIIINCEQIPAHECIICRRGTRHGTRSKFLLEISQNGQYTEKGSLAHNIWLYHKQIIPPYVSADEDSSSSKQNPKLSGTCTMQSVLWNDMAAGRHGAQLIISKITSVVMTYSESEPGTLSSTCVIAHFLPSWWHEGIALPEPRQCTRLARGIFRMIYSARTTSWWKHSSISFGFKFGLTAG